MKANKHTRKLKEKKKLICRESNTKWNGGNKLIYTKYKKKQLERKWLI